MLQMNARFMQTWGGDEGWGGEAVRHVSQREIIAARFYIMSSNEEEEVGFRCNILGYIRDCALRRGSTGGTDFRERCSREW